MADGEKAEGVAASPELASSPVPVQEGSLAADEKEAGDIPAELQRRTSKEGGEIAVQTQRRSSKEGGDSSQQPQRRASKEQGEAGTEPQRRASRKLSRKGSKSTDGAEAGKEAKRRDSRRDSFDDEEVEEVPKIMYPIDPKIQQTLRTAWTLFVKKNQKKKTEISEGDIPTVMRSIGINPTETQIKNFIAYVQSIRTQGLACNGWCETESHKTRSQDVPTCSKGFLTYENFEQRVAETLHLEPAQWIRKSKDEILAALYTICNNEEDVPGEKFKKILMTKGDVMTDPEGSMMLRTARDRDTGKVYVQEYADILAKDAVPQPPPDPTVW